MVLAVETEAAVHVSGSTGLNPHQQSPAFIVTLTKVFHLLEDPYTHTHTHTLQVLHLSCNLFLLFCFHDSKGFSFFLRTSSSSVPFFRIKATWSWLLFSFSKYARRDRRKCQNRSQNWKSSSFLIFVCLRWFGPDVANTVLTRCLLAFFENRCVRANCPSANWQALAGQLKRN